MKKLSAKEFIIGISVIAALVILFFGIDYLKGINLFTPANFYYAEYDNVSGLEVAAPVQINGYKVGQVRDIEFDYKNHGKVKVLLALNKDLELPEDSHAQIASTLLSGSYINIVVGTSKKMLSVGGTLKSSVTPDLMSSLQDDLMPQVSGVISRVDTLLGGVNMLVTDPAMYQAMRRIDGISNNILLASEGLNNTLSKDVPGLMNQASHSMTKIDTICYNLAVLSSQLKSLPIASTMDNVHGITGNLYDVSSNLNTFSSQINDKNSTLGMLTQDPELYNRLNRVTADIDSLILDIKKNPKRYISIKLL
ncbi:MAG: MlaD family protein [Prevotella sp.]|nr:MlaD family protein [Bacteroides sp.]MCM1365900.1 MlaD family protein [Prevotella sp.]